jgi:hypothetical protein
LKINQFFLLLLVSAVNYGQAVRKYSNEFMNIGVDAAALGMANAVTASTSDVNSVLEPSGLTHLEDHQLSLMHANYFANIAQYDYIGYASPLTTAVLGVFLIRFGVDDILNTTELIDSQGNVITIASVFSTADYGFIFLCAKITRWISIWSQC